MKKVSNILRVLIPLFFGVIMFTLFILITGLRERSQFSLLGFLWFIIMTSIFWEGSRFISKKIDSKFSSKTSLPKKLVWQLIALICFGIITFNVSYLLIRLHEIYIQGNTGNGFDVTQFVSMSAIGTFLVLAIGGLQMRVF